jgi:hypothetical protein
MEDEAGRVHPWPGRAEVQIAISAAWVGLVASGIAIVMTGVLSWVGAAGDPRRLAMVLAVAGCTVVLLAALTLTVTLPPGPARVASLKRDLARAYAEALDDSVLDPNRGGGR